jgi:broad specificity polyphosphatase/5'/3'-nucleotidase SurE
VALEHLKLVERYQMQELITQKACQVSYHLMVVEKLLPLVMNQSWPNYRLMVLAVPQMEQEQEKEQFVANVGQEQLKEAQDQHQNRLMNFLF